MSDKTLKTMKLFARNLTARADSVVRGNPVSSRPESGVENSWPGLEFDQRNLDKAFFPGLVFEFHDSRATILREFGATSPAAKFYKKSDIAKGIYLAFVQGSVVDKRTGAAAVRKEFSFQPPAGLENWRVIRDFEAGPVAVALCDRATYDGLLANSPSNDFRASLFTPRKSGRNQGFVVLFGERASYLTSDGVIDPVLVPPGNLTRSMCSPWQYDFTDCGCFFWASNKPDMVASEEQPLQILNFQRKNRKGDKARQPTDWLLKDGPANWDFDNMLDHVDLINDYNRLKFVIAGRERDDYTPPAPPAPARLLTRAEIIERLKILAGVEHALCVQYLYACYSLKLPEGMRPGRSPWAPPERDPGETSVEARIFTAADEVLRVAIDEMRHFRWVNEILDELGEHWVLDRAEIIGIDFPEQKGLNHPFELKPLNPEQLAWFIKVEKASPNHENPATIDGMYTRILRSIEEGAEFARDPAHRDKLAQLVKMIIAEGVDHYHRFLRVEEALAGMNLGDYLNVTSAPKPAMAGSPEKILQDTADLSYAVLLRALDYVFQQGKVERGALLEAARRAMYNIDDACRALSARNAGAMFTLPAGKNVAAARGEPKLTAQAVGDPLRAHLKNMRQSGNAELSALAERMNGKLDELTAGLANAAVRRS